MRASFFTKYICVEASTLYHLQSCASSLRFAADLIFLSIGYWVLDSRWSELGIQTGRTYYPRYLGKSYLTVMWKCATAEASVMEDLNGVILSDLHVRCKPSNRYLPSPLHEEAFFVCSSKS